MIPIKQVIQGIIGQYFAQDPPPLLKWRDDFLAAKSGSWSSDSKRCYESVINLYIKYVGEDQWPPDRSDILSWLDDVRSRNTETTAATYWKHIRTWLNYLEGIGMLDQDTNPVHIIKKLRLQPREPKDLEYIAFEKQELEELFAYLDHLPDSLYAARDLALLRFQYVSGCRSGEVVQLKIKDLDLTDDTPWARIGARNSKSRRFRYVYFNNEVAAELKGWLEMLAKTGYRGEYVFPSLRYGRPGGPMLAESINQMLRRRLKQANLPQKKAHALRHAHAEHGVEKVGIKKVQKQLGHSDLRTTARYLRGRDKDRGNAYKNW